MWPGSSLKKRVKNVSSSFLMAVQAIDFSLNNIILIPIYSMKSDCNGTSSFKLLNYDDVKHLKRH